METHQVVPHAEWIEARKQLLAREKEFTKLRDELSAARRAMPWEKIEKTYRFQGPSGVETLADLFDGASQLIIYHFMFGPDAEAGCKSCSFWADNFERNVVHLRARDVTMIAASRGAYDRLQAFKRRMGWTFKWVSTIGDDFNFDYQASATPEEIARGSGYYNYADGVKMPPERPGVSVFYKDDAGAVFHTYSAYSRGIDMFNAAYHYLDVAPKGRDEDGLPHAMAWVRYRDNYAPRSNVEAAA